MIAARFLQYLVQVYLIHLARIFYKLMSRERGGGRATGLPIADCGFEIVQY